MVHLSRCIGEIGIVATDDDESCDSEERDI